MMLPKIFAEKICYYEGLISDPYALVEALEASDSALTDSDAIEPWHPWEASGDGDVYLFGLQKYTDDSKLETSSSSVKNLYSVVHTALTEAGKDYAARFNIEYVEPNALSISKYSAGAEMGPHVDNYGQKNLQTLMSAVAYLNDDYEGGELRFPQQGVTIKPSAGSVVVFPSEAPFYHQSLLVTRGSKYMSPAFWTKWL